MTRTDRRQVLQLAIGASLAHLCLPQIARAAAVHKFAPPMTPFQYERGLRRYLVGGAKLEVRRTFSIRIVPTVGGFRVEGTQAGVTVDAPAGLEAFAELERERTEDGIFPIALDSQGWILSGTPHTDTQAFEVAVKTASERISAINITGGERASLQDFVEAVHRAGASLTTQLPADLFSPMGDQPVVNTQTIAIPGGGQGQVSTVYSAQTYPDTGLMRQARREVVTEMEGDQRRTVEDWRIVPA